MFEKLNRMANRAIIATQCRVREFFRKENGDVNIVSIVVLIGIAVLLAVVFRGKIENLLNRLFSTIGTKANEALQ